MLNLKVARFLFTMTVREPMILPPYKGTTFRGGFGKPFGVLLAVGAGKTAMVACLPPPVPTGYFLSPDRRREQKS
jgi:hypothetical protein